jgi:putative mRNA 3-end processing factor
MRIDFKGGCREVGRSAILVNEEILIDYGIKPGDRPDYPVDGIFPKSIFVSHGHLDHCGAVPNLMDLSPEVYMTHMTSRFTEILGRDTLKISERRGLPEPYDEGDLQKLSQITRRKHFGEEVRTNDYLARIYSAGHIPGASSIYLEDNKGESLLYTGDISTSDSRLVSKADTLPDVDVLITESTYFGEDHPPRKETEKAFIESVIDTIDIGGTVIIPAFAIGRTQAIMMLLHSEKIPCFVDGMGVAMTDEMLNHPEYLKDPIKLEKAFGFATTVKGNKRNKIPLEGSVIVTTAGMLNGGPVLYYLDKKADDPKTKVMLTGYQVEGTNGRLALDSGFLEINDRIQHLRCKLEQYDFSAHCGDKELKELVRDFCDRGTETVYTMHGDDAEGFAQWIMDEIGVEAYAPATGETLMTR